MPKNILTILTNLVKKVFQRYWLGPLSMALTIAIIYTANLYAPAWITASLVLAIIPMTISQYFGGLRSSLVCAVMASVYVFWSPNFDLSRSVQIAGSFTFAAWLGGLLKQNERRGVLQLQAALAQATESQRQTTAALIETQAAREMAHDALIRAQEGEEAVKAMTGLNGNIERILMARNKMLDIVNTAELAQSVRAELGIVLHILNNLLLAVKGWQEYAELRARMGKEKLG